MKESKKIAIITDTTCDIPEELIKEHSIYLIPMRIVFENEEFRDRFEISPAEVYDRLETEIPKSSLPLSDDIKNIMDYIIEKGYTDAIIITVSSGLSGTNNMINLMMEDYKDKINIEIVDSLYLSMGLGFQVLECAKTVKETGSVIEGLERIKEVRKSMSAMFVVKTLLYLKKGGRIGKVEGTVGDMLHIKPIISINEDGIYYTLAKIRGRKNSVQKMIDLLKDKYKNKSINLGISHGLALDEAESLLNRLRSALNVKKDCIVQISPVLGMHTGPGLLGVIAYESK
jgi:DegV family protein with EDD domain